MTLAGESVWAFVFLSVRLVLYLLPLLVRTIDAIGSRERRGEESYTVVGTGPHVLPNARFHFVCRVACLYTEV